MYILFYALVFIFILRIKCKLRLFLLFIPLFGLMRFIWSVRYNNHLLNFVFEAYEMFTSIYLLPATTLYSL
jgi:hypothetical protein